MSLGSKVWLKRSLISIAVTSALLGQTLSAAETEQQVETLTVTGQQDAALDISIDQDSLEKSQASNLKDIFKDEAQVSVGGGSAISQKIYVRDLESTMLNVTIDGAKQSSNNFHHQGNISIEPELIQQVQVQAGAGDALSGAGALAGSISFTTKDPEDLLNAGERFGALVKGSYGSNANTYKASLSLYGALTDNWSAMATIVQTEADDYTDGDGDEAGYTAYDQQNGLVKLVGKFENNQRLSFSFDNRIDDGEKLFRTNWSANSTYAIDLEADRATSKVEYSINPTDNKWLALETNAYYTENHILRLNDAADGTIETYGFDIRNASQFAEHLVTYGFDYHNDTSNYTSNDQTTTNVDESDVYGIYLQAQLQLAQAWLLNVGSRFDVYQTTDASGQDFEDKGFNPNISLQFTPQDNLQLELGYAQAMRGVGVMESFLMYDGSSYENSADLSAETAENFEFSVDYQLRGVGLSATVYHSTIDDVIATGDYIRGDGNPYYTYDNRGELVTKGLSLGINYSWQALQTSVIYNHNTSELNGKPLDDYDLSLGTSTGDKINTNVNYQWSNSLEFGWSATFVTRLNDVHDDFDEKAGYGVHDVYGQWLPLNDDALKVTLSISNLLDKTYRDHATYGVNSAYNYEGDKAPGRDFKIALAWAF